MMKYSNSKFSFFVEKYISSRWKIIASYIILFLASLVFIDLFYEKQNVIWFFKGLSVNILTFFVVDIIWHNHLFRIGELRKKIIYSAFIEEMKSANKIVRVHTTYSLMLDCGFEEGNKYKNDNERYWKEFKYALFTLVKKRQTRKPGIEVLLLDPNSDTANQRNNERNNIVIPSINKNLTGLYNLLKQNPELNDILEVKVYNRLPGLQLHQIDSEISVSPFPPLVPAFEQKRMVYKEHTDAAKFHVDWFMDTWNDEERTLSLFDFMEVKVDFIGLTEAVPILKSIALKYVRLINSKETYLILEQETYENVINEFNLDLKKLRYIVCSSPLNKYSEFSFVKNQIPKLEHFRDLQELAYKKYSIKFIYFLELLKKVDISVS